MGNLQGHALHLRRLLPGCKQLLTPVVVDDCIICDNDMHGHDSVVIPDVRMTALVQVCIFAWICLPCVPILHKQPPSPEPFFLPDNAPTQSVAPYKFNNSA